MCVVNTAVLDALDLDAVAEGGAVVLDNDGQPTGLLQEQAQNLVHDLAYPYPLDGLVDAIGRAHQQYLAEGITSIQEAGIGGGWIGHNPGELAAYQQARAQGQLRVRTTLMPAAEVLHPLAGHADDELAACLDLGARCGFGDDWLRLGPVKVFADGSLIGHTAAMHEDYVGDAGNRGYLQSSPDRLRRTILDAHRTGWQVATHAIGDRAVDTVLDIYAEALATWPRPDHRHRSEHCGVTSPAALQRIAELGVIPNTQARFISELGDGMAEALGPERTRWCYRQRSFLDRGITLPASSDRPVVNGAPLAGIHDLSTSAPPPACRSTRARPSPWNRRYAPTPSARRTRPPRQRPRQPYRWQARRLRHPVRRPHPDRPHPHCRHHSSGHRARRPAGPQQRRIQLRQTASQAATPARSTGGFPHPLPTR